MSYKIVRVYFKGSKYTIKRGLSEEQARAHCNNPQTSSSTCTNAVGKQRTKKYGPWFDSYSKE